MCVCAHARTCEVNHIQLLATAWTVGHQSPLSMGFPSQEYWSGLPSPSPGDLPNPGIKPTSLASPASTHRWILYHQCHQGRRQAVIIIFLVLKPDSQKMPMQEPKAPGWMKALLGPLQTALIPHQFGFNRLITGDNLDWVWHWSPLVLPMKKRFTKWINNINLRRMCALLRRKAVFNPL